jgi:mono/diheme cytochrome c family protein
VRYAQLQAEPALRAAVLQDCTVLTPEVDLKWNAVEPTPGGWSLENIDGLVSLASQSGKTVRGHTLLWHLGTPPWVEQRLREHRDWRLVSRHFAAVMQRHGDTIHQWDVVNEPIETGYRMDGLRRSVFLEAFGPDYIRRAFVEARIAAPRARLMLNEFGLEYDSREERDRRYLFLKLVEGLKRAAAPLESIFWRSARALDARRGAGARTVKMNRWSVLFGVGVAAAAAACDGGPKTEVKPPAPSTSSASAAPSPSAAGSSAARPADPSPSGLTPAEIAEYNHLPEGGELLPLDMVRAVESVKTFKPFMEDLERFRLIPDPSDPDGLPVGMSAAMASGRRAEPRMVFFNCAACHTAEITYGGKNIRVLGAPAHFDMAGLIVELLASFAATLVDPKKLSAFLTRLAKLGSASGGADLAKAYPDLKLPSADAEGALLDKMKGLVKEQKAKAADLMEQKKVRIESAADAVRLLKAKIAYLQGLRGLRTTTIAGFGRLDAFMAARNLLFGEKFAMDVDSPVSLPPIFGLAKLSWYHYDNNTTSILQRNIGEDLGVGAVADKTTGESTVLARNLLRLEALAAKFPAPKWPEDVLGKLDVQSAARGAPLYKKECASCHDPDADGAFPDRTFELSAIGTDPNRAVNFAKPLGDRPFAEGLAAVLDSVQKKAFEREQLTPAEIAAIERRPVEWRGTNKYASRPLAGVWATAPYLHNGSVPTLDDLLLPPEKRPKTFLTGSREFEPKKVGYVSDGSGGGTFLFDTNLSGNHNTGHTYGTALSDEARRDLLEYLKTL